MSVEEAPEGFKPIGIKGKTGFVGLLLKTLILAAYAFLAVLVARQVLEFGDAKWLKVKMHASAFGDAPLQLEISLKKPVEGLYLRVDLHWMDESKKSRGYYAGSKAVQVSAKTAVYPFSYSLEKGDSAAFVFPVAYLSRDGTWGKRVKIAIGTPVPILRSKGPSGPLPLLTNRAQDVVEQPAPPRTESLPLRLLTAGIWLLVAIIPLVGQKRPRNLWLAAAALSCSLWEAFRLDTLVASGLRYFAWQDGWYLERRGPQYFISFIVLGIMLVLAIVLFVRSRRPSLALAWLAISAFWGIALLRVLSLHELDAVLARSLYGFQAGQLVNVVFSLLCLGASAIYTLAPFNPATTQGLRN